MEIREKIKLIYKNIGVRIGEDYLDGIMANKPRVEALLKNYEEMLKEGVA